MQRLAIIGSSDLGKLIAYHATTDQHYRVVGFYDDFAKTGPMNLPILGPCNQVAAGFEAGLFDALFIGVGYNHMAFRKQLFETHFGTIPFGKVLHSSCFIDQSVKIGEGVFMLPGCTLDSGVEIGNNVVLNTAATVAHDTAIGAHSFLGPSAAIAGKCHIGDCCFIGINATVIDHLHLASGTQLGAGSVAISNINQPGLYVGIPARAIKKSLP